MMTLEQVLALLGTMGALAAGTITVVVFMMRATKGQLENLRREINEKFDGCQKLCGNEVRHLNEDVKELKLQIVNIWEEMFETTWHGTPVKKKRSTDE